MKSREYFKGALYDKKVPILVLDQKWHRLFAIHGKSEEIKQFEEELNGLLARQFWLSVHIYIFFDIFRRISMFV